jgi:hypothetical protein
MNDPVNSLVLKRPPHLMQPQEKKKQQKKTTVEQQQQQQFEEHIVPSSVQPSSVQPSQPAIWSSISTRPSLNAAQIHNISTTYDFFVVLENSTPFKNMVEMISPILESVTFKIINKTSEGKTFKGIFISSMSKSKVAMVMGNVVVQTLYPENLATQTFTVNTAEFNDTLKILEKNCCLEIKRLKDQNNVILRGFNANNKNREAIIEHTTLVDTSDAFKLNPINYNYTVSMELSPLKSMTRAGSSAAMDSTEIEFQIFEFINTEDNTKFTKVCISLGGDKCSTKMSQVFWSKTKWDESNPNKVVIKTDNIDETESEQELYIGIESKMTSVFQEKYSTKYLYQFFKCMDRASVMLKLSPESPIVIIYPLDGGESVGTVSFILAPTVKSTDQ